MRSISAPLREDMEKKGIDVSLTLEILDAYNEGFYDTIESVRARGVPQIDGSSVIDLRGTGRVVGGSGASDDPSSAPDPPVFTFSAEKAQENLAAFGLKCPAPVSENMDFSASDLLAIGTTILRFAAYGVLNGGSATSYADGKKNLALGAEAFDSVAPAFAALAPLCRDMPKGMTPAYINPDGSPGASFLELKMRARLLLAAASPHSPSDVFAPTRHGRPDSGFLPLFQMTSRSNDATLTAYYENAISSPFLHRLAQQTGIAPAPWLTGVQPMIAAYSHSSEGRPKKIFDVAYGRQETSLPLPGGHGQCFRVLAAVLRELRGKGIRYACLGNVDNLGYTPDPVELAVMAISGQPAGFDFAVRTPMDVKGGILIETESSGRTVADIGPAISFEAVLDLERRGYSILFNCASGIFDLDYLVPRIDEIARRLPLRFSDQDKDAGKYSQAEQVTWEVTGILPSFLAFAVDKRDRFIAAKLLIDTLLTSGIGIGNPSLPENLRATATSLHEGLASLLRNTYGLELCDGKWTPKELISR